ncbi:MAG: hypothetical protein QXX08_07345, partial [Candidatus Bathyarchaeia archaeon]
RITNFETYSRYSACQHYYFWNMRLPIKLPLAPNTADIKTKGRLKTMIAITMWGLLKAPMFSATTQQRTNVYDKSAF